ncbi:light-regulated protein, chloroplastic [Cucumis sativus]|uniref:Light-regulated protein n=2 Tax=Cucumis sativus TaxID=3659 RepID=A0A0A0L8G9_CUCSA|nr:light-regulated protein, chloroplastic [Cucumis sativus]
MLIQISKPYLQHIIKITMQAVLSIAVPSLLPSSTLSSNKPSHFPLITFSSHSSRRSSIKATASVVYDTSVVDYSSAISVFPAEACETIGGEACGWENMFPEVRLQQASLNNQNPVASSEEIDREYLDYADSKTVFPGEACDDLGGEFCEPEFLNGVF